MQVGQAVAKDAGGTAEDHDDRQGVDALAQHPPDALPVQTLVHHEADDQAVDDGDGRGLGSGEHPAHHADDHDEYGQQRPDGLSKLLEEHRQGKLIALGIVALYRDDVRADHQRYGQ